VLAVLGEVSGQAQKHHETTGDPISFGHSTGSIKHQGRAGKRSV
jgi:hypothetical protein